MKILPRWPVVVATLAAAAPGCAAVAAGGMPFEYKTTFRNVTADPDGVWTGKALALTGDGRVTIHEYSLATPQGDWLVSQIWNADCSSNTCPTRLVKIAPNGRREVVVDDMMHQVIPPGAPRLASLPGTTDRDAYARHPFWLSANGKALVNSDFVFPLSGAGK